MVAKTQHFSEVLYPTSLVPTGGKICSKSLYLWCFFRSTTFSISAKIQDGGWNSGKSTFFRSTISDISSTQGLQNLLKITLFLMVFKIDIIFNFIIFNFIVIITIAMITNSNTKQNITPITCIAYLEKIAKILILINELKQSVMK